MCYVGLQHYRSPSTVLPMSDKTTPTVRKVDDPRVESSTRQLGVALVELLHERTFDSITVNDILERAGVGRTTFYAHYRNKQDVLLSSYERMFDAFEHQLQLPVRSGFSGAISAPRVLPVREFSTHVRDMADLLRAIRESGQMEDLWELATGSFARMIERRIVPVPSVPRLSATGAELSALEQQGDAAVPASLVSRMLAGAFLEMLKWWLERPESTSPAALDDTFHEIVKGSLARVGYRVAAVQG